MTKKIKIGVGLLDLIYPIGSIYISINNTNPSSLFRGTWSSIGQGRTLVGVDPTQTEFNAVKKMGGSKYVQDHTHTVKYQSFGIIDNQAIDSGYGSPKRATVFNVNNTKDVGALKAAVLNVPTGNSGNLQPYICVYFWIRTA